MKTKMAPLSMDDVFLVAGALAHAAKGKKLHPRAAAALTEVGKARKAIVTARELQRDERSESFDGPRVTLRQAHVEARKRLRALARLLQVLAELPDGEQDGDVARRLYARAFPRGTTYIRGSVAAIVSGAATVVDLAIDEAAWKDIPSAERFLVEAARAIKTLASLYNEAACTPQEQRTAGTYMPLVSAIRRYAQLVEAAGALDPTMVVSELLAPLSHAQPARRKKSAPTPPSGDSEPVTESPDDEEAPPSLAA